MIKKVDLSKYGNKKSTAKESNAMLDMAKAMIPSLPRKVKLYVVIALYFLISGVIANFYLIYKLISALHIK